MTSMCFDFQHLNLEGCFNVFFFLIDKNEEMENYRITTTIYHPNIVVLGGCDIIQQKCFKIFVVIVVIHTVRAVVFTDWHNIWRWTSGQGQGISGRRSNGVFRLSLFTNTPQFLHGDPKGFLIQVRCVFPSTKLAWALDPHASHFLLKATELHHQERAEKGFYVPQTIFS